MNYGPTKKIYRDPLDNVYLVDGTMVEMDETDTGRDSMAIALGRRLNDGSELADRTDDESRMFQRVGE